MSHASPEVSDSPALSKLAALSLVGGAVGFAVEMLHQRAGVWRLQDDSTVPIWIVGIYVLALLGTGVAFSLFERRYEHTAPLRRAELVTELVLFAALFMSPPVLHSHELALTAIATGYLALRLVLYRQPGDSTVAVAVIIANLAIEATLITIGLYSYTNAQWLPVPLWLAPLWGGLGLGLRRLFRVVNRRHQGLGTYSIVILLILTATVTGCCPRGQATSTLSLDAARTSGSRVGDIGTAHPILVEAVDPEGQWVVACQARRDTDGDGHISVGLGQHGDTYGDRMEPYLIEGWGPGVPIDAFVGADPAGRFLVIVDDGQFLLVDTRENTLDVLGPQVGSTERSGSPMLRGGAFDREGRRFVYIREQPDRSEVVVRNLERGSETTVDPGSGVLLYAEPSPDVEWLILDMVTRDTDADGVLEAPTVHTSLPAGQCTGPALSYSSWGYEGDVPDRLAISADGGQPYDMDEMLGFFDGLLLQRRADGSVVGLTPDGDEVEVVPASCDAGTIVVDTRRAQLLTACRAEGPPFELRWYSLQQESSAVGLSVASDVERFHRTSDRFVQVRTADTVALVDLETASVVPLELGEYHYDTNAGRQTLVRIDDEIWLRSIDEDRYREEMSEPTAPDPFRRDPIAVGLPQQLPSFDSTAVRCAANGRLLVVSEPVEFHSVPLGPLRWVDSDACAESQQEM